MLRSTRAVMILLMVSSFCIPVVNAADKATLSGEKQKKRVGDYGYIESEAECVNGKRGHSGTFIKLKAAKSAIAKGGNGPAVSAAAVLNFPKGTQVDYLSFTYFKLGEGTVFTETTDPIVRVCYSTEDNRNALKYKTLSWPISSAGFTGTSKSLPTRVLRRRKHLYFALPSLLNQKSTNLLTITPRWKSNTSNITNFSVKTRTFSLLISTLTFAPTAKAQVNQVMNS